MRTASVVRALALVVALGAGMAIGTYALGWWAVPLLAAAWGVLARAHRFASGAALAGALLAWAALYLWAVSQGPVARLAIVLAPVLQLPAAGLLAVTLLFPALLAWSAARVAQLVTARVPAARLPPVAGPGT